MVSPINPELLYPEVKFQASRSSGAGGQHVNKVNTRVELRFDVAGSDVLSDEQKLLLQEKLSHRISKEGVLIIVSEKSRSQYRNKENCFEKFRELIIEAFIPPKKRVATKPGFSVKRKRLESKKIQSLKKQQRKRPDY